MPPADPPPEARTGPARLRSLLVPALFLMLGVVLGVVTTLAATGGSGSPSGNTAAGPAPAATATAATAPAVTASGRTVTVPASCERGMARAQAAMQTLGEAGQALGNLQSARLQALLNELQQAQTDVDRLAAECRQEARAAN